MILHDVIYFIR